MRVKKVRCPLLTAVFVPRFTYLRYIVRACMRMYMCVWACVCTHEKVLSNENIRPLSETYVARIERKYNEVNIISQKLALHGRVCKYGMLLFEAVSRTGLRVTSAKIVSISTVHEAYVEDMAASIEPSDSIYMTTKFIVF
ncbi:hypothetical protein WN48_05440 [Eufriesea mexicana]|nr:hypothetical protein WN48_05440 [Eufriesea mexicana]